MKLLKLELTEKTETHYLFTITVKAYSTFSKPTTSKYDCSRRIDFSQSVFINSGRRLYQEWSAIDDAINAILSMKNPHYEKT